MKVTIEFNGEEEQEDLQLALNGHKWKSAMWELDQELRNTIKYGESFLPNKNISEQEILIAEGIRKYLRQIVSNYNLNLD
jgi:hypothetical protein